MIAAASMRQRHKDYVNRYFRGKLFARTQLFHWTENNVGACTWALLKDAAKEGRFTTDDLASMKENERTGVTSGVTISFHASSRRSKGALGLIADLGLTDQDVDEIWGENCNFINAIAQVLHLKLIQFPIAGRSRPLERISL